MPPIATGAGDNDGGRIALVVTLRKRWLALAQNLRVGCKKFRVGWKRHIKRGIHPLLSRKQRPGCFAQLL